MKEFMPLPKIGEIILNDFMEPLNLSVNELASKINVAPAVISQLLYGETQMTFDLSQRLGQLYELQDDSYFMRLQQALNERVLTESNPTELKAALAK